MLKDLSKVTVKPLTEEDIKNGTEMWVHAQGITDYIVPVFSIDKESNEVMIVGTKEGAIYITKEQCMAFYNLKPIEDKKAMIGFNCKHCAKPFFVMHNTPQDILDDSKVIKAYQEKGFKLIDIEIDFKDLNNWCGCKLADME